VKNASGGAELRGRLTVAAYRMAVPLAGAVPPRVAYPILDRLADLIRLTATDARQAVEANLEQVLGRRGRRHAWAVRGVFRHAMRNYYDTFRLPSMSNDEIRDRVVLSGREHLRSLLAEGRGAVLVSAHVSSVALAAQALALAERGGTVVVEPVRPPELLELMLRVRGSHGLAYRTVGPALFGELTATLRRNELVFLVVDRDVGGTGIYLELFGRPTRLPTGPALLALRTGAPIVPTYVSRRRDGRLDGVVDRPVQIRKTGDRRADLTEISRLVTARLEYHIGRYPEQWTVLQRVWGPPADAHWAESTSWGDPRGAG
jgi:lauroyl/myristoyl acyltransferase